jgi:hypothetical protein
MFETTLEGFLDDLVVAVVFAACIESSFPSVAPIQVAWRNKFHDAVRNGKGTERLHNEFGLSRLTGPAWGTKQLTAIRNFSSSCVFFQVVFLSSPALQSFCGRQAVRFESNQGAPVSKPPTKKGRFGKRPFLTFSPACPRLAARARIELAKRNPSPQSSPFEKGRGVRFSILRFLRFPQFRGLGFPSKKETPHAR